MKLEGKLQEIKGFNTANSHSKFSFFSLGVHEPDDIHLGKGMATN